MFTDIGGTPVLLVHRPVPSVINLSVPRCILYIFRSESRVSGTRNRLASVWTDMSVLWFCPPSVRPTTLPSPPIYRPRDVRVTCSPLSTRTITSPKTVFMPLTVAHHVTRLLAGDWLRPIFERYKRANHRLMIRKHKLAQFMTDFMTCGRKSFA